ncbi:zinc-binding alcohol dehydrogenase family protein [Bacillus haynesii]|uniref:zinc-binding alcohol dehydrogenase family protein n=1 Tax=Bacillus haynesii TaxID=1925021 RepID=UPI00227DA1C8|nr:zinc-binding alcohol dehydrogenase family protein [Bacillus haynesii]MCY9276299.1 zinc-binding alcohol dehydrogenase family protein [Bacillus haynesii]MCY9399060.1 zinc-binding alcohol dehydrogenase family protein [Bacillus haynesii]MEC0709976.1 zinc-binding alcohol dehydrogenase family protein [Bacillus haynesii]MEC0737778.1 zinc-binding alcohol dehydrogenase family protein [Bacillus haynesii]
MKQIVCEKPYHFKMTDVKMPELKDGEALVRIKRIGICGTDFHAYCGRQPFFSYPRVLGHELSGEIVSIDDTGGTLKPGDQVSIIPYLECGTCIACRNSRPNCCVNLNVLGVHTDGGMREYINIPADHLIKTEGLTLSEAAVVECLSIGAHAAERAKIKKGETVLVVGAGPIGLSVMKFAKLKGAKIIAMDVRKERLTFSREWAEADEVVLAGEHAADEIKRLTNGDFPTAVFDATGHLASMNSAYQYAAHGGRLIYVGLINDHLAMPDPEIHKRELTILSSRNALKSDFETVMKAIRDGGADANRFITGQIAFRDVVDRFQSALAPETNPVKVLIHL